jgi:hypothetical protein
MIGPQFRYLCFYRKDSVPRCSRVHNARLCFKSGRLLIVLHRPCFTKFSVQHPSTAMTPRSEADAQHTSELKIVLAKEENRNQKPSGYWQTQGASPGHEFCRRHKFRHGEYRRRSYGVKGSTLLLRRQVQHKCTFQLLLFIATQ